MGSNNWSRQEGHLQITFKGGNGRYNHRVTLSPRSESFFSAVTRSYTVVAPWPIEYIERAAISWFSAKSSLFSTPKIYVDRVVIDPAYIPNWP